VVAHALGLVRPHRLQRLALIRHVSGIEGLGDRGEIYVDPPDYSILNPVAPGIVNLSLVVPLAHAKPFSSRLGTFMEARLRQLRHVPARLAGMKAEGPVMAMGPLAYRVEEPRVGGVLLAGDAAGAQPLSGMRIIAPDGTVLDGTYPTSGPWRGYRDHALAIRREVFDRILLERARALPVDVRERHRVTGLLVEGGVVRGVKAESAVGAPVEVRSRLVVGADGRASVVAHALGLVRPHRLRRLANGAARFLQRRPALLSALMGVIGDFVPPRALLRGLRG